MYSYHVFLLPLAVVAIVVAHILLVRRHGIVPPFQLSDRAARSASATKVDPEPVPKREPSVGNEGSRDVVSGEAAP
jgi:ubiquinol-cytochrome c reductase cytochrome b subunit